MQRSVGLMAALLLAGCASKPSVVAVAPPPVVPTAAMPVAPAGVAATFQLPARTAAGGWWTPNRGLSQAAAVWHLRAGLNVAALGCRDAAEPTRVAAYNALLTRHEAGFAAAFKTLSAEARAASGKDWQDAQDDAMTRLYNFWAQPFAAAELCAAADSVLAEAALLPATDLPGYAPAALARLEAPFTAFYDRYAGYQAALAAWRAGRAAPVQVAAAVPALRADAPALRVDPVVFTDAAVAR